MKTSPWHHGPLVLAAALAACGGQTPAGADAASGIDAAAPTDAPARDAAAPTDTITPADVITPGDVLTPADVPPTRRALPAPPAASVDAAIRDTFIRYARTLPGGAYTNRGGNGGASIVLALASFVGNTATDARLLAQIRFTITGGNDICANGGYPAQHELFMTGAFALARRTPRVWDALTSAEHDRIDALMEASLVGSAFTTSDANPFVAGNTQQYTLDGDSNVNRDWNPNYRNGMQGSVLVAAAYFGVPTAQSLLRAYDHAAFVARLATLGLTNAHEIFNWRAANPTSHAPTALQIEAAAHAYAYHAHTLDDVMGFFQQLSDGTYNSPVACGLNGGAGISLADGGASGVIAAGCAGLPNRGAMGMEAEFASVDAEGPRSASFYVYDGYKGNLITLLVLVASGVWQDGAAATEVLARERIGITDFWYKLDQGYHDYAHARDYGVSRSSDTDSGYVYMRPLWDDVVRVYFGL